MGKSNEKELPQQSTKQFLTVIEAAQILRISRRTVYNLINRGLIQTIRITPRMTRISMSELLRLVGAEDNEVVTERSSSFPSVPYSGETDEVAAKPETGSTNKTAKCRKTPKAGEKAPEGVTHDTHYTMAEVLSKFGIKYGRFYEVRNRYRLQSVHAWGTTAFKKEEVEEAIAKYNEEMGRDTKEAYYTCFDIMQKFGLSKTQVRRFAEAHGVRIKKAKGGQSNLYLKADWDAARKKAAQKSVCVKPKRD